MVCKDPKTSTKFSYFFHFALQLDHLMSVTIQTNSSFLVKKRYIFIDLHTQLSSVTNDC